MDFCGVIKTPKVTNVTQQKPERRLRAANVVLVLLEPMTTVLLTCCFQSDACDDRSSVALRRTNGLPWGQVRQEPKLRIILQK